MWKRIINTSLLLLFLFWLPGMCSAATDQQTNPGLVQLKIELAAVYQNNEQLAINCSRSELALTQAQEQLAVSETRTNQLETQLATLSGQTQAALNSSKTAENDLSAANKLLTEWKKEQDKAMSKLKQENKIYKLVLVGLVAKALM